MTASGFETLIEDDVVAIVRAAIGETRSPDDAAVLAATRILELEKVREAFAAWWREESWSDIFDGPDCR
jgi:hypothetical protein